MRQTGTALLALTSAIVIWLLSVAAIVIFAMALLLVPMVLAAIAGTVIGIRLSPRTVEIVTVVAIVTVTLIALPMLSTAPVRFSLRAAPLSVGQPASRRIPHALWVSWLLVVAGLVAGDSEWITVLVAVAVGVVGLARAHRFRPRWKGLPDRRTVLFLRRFGKTADRLVSTAVRRATPPSASVAFLIGDRQGPSSWDPIQVGFDGLQRDAVPLYLQSTSARWQQDVQVLVTRADAIVLDASDWSGSMDAEVAIVDGCGARDRLIVIARAGRAAERALAGRTVLAYHRSWNAAFQRIFWGGLLALVPAIQGEEFGFGRAGLIAVSVPAFIAWLLLVVRPLMDEASAKSLAEKLAILCGDAEGGTPRSPRRRG
jgi:hypothetical protein